MAIRDTSFMPISSGNPSDSAYISYHKFEYQTIPVERLVIFGPLIPIVPRIYRYSNSFKISNIDSCPTIEIEKKGGKFNGKKEDHNICVYGFKPDLEGKYWVHLKGYTDEVNFVEISNWRYCPFCTM